MRALRRRSAVLLLTVPVFAVLAMIGAPAASAHPLGNFTVNHADALLVSPGHVRVTYVLDMAEIPTFQQRTSVDTDGDGTITTAERQAWATGEARSILPQLSLAVDDRPVALAGTACQATMTYRPGQGGLPILRLVAAFDASVPATGTLAFRDETFPGRIGWKEVTAAGASGVTLSGSTVPATSASDLLQRYPVDLLSNPLDVTAATLAFRSTGATAGVLSCSAAGAGTTKAASNAFASLVTKRLTPLVLLASLVLAFVFGVVHALGPGHGKTITAAYLVGAGARVRQAFGVGAAVALMHTASVLALGLTAAALSSSFPSERIYPWLTLATGAFALSLGLGMLALRLRARRAGLQQAHGHAHPWDAWHEHEHEHEHDHEHEDDHDHEQGARHAAMHAEAFGATTDTGGVATLVRSDPPHDHPIPADEPSVAATGRRGEDRAVSRPRLAALAVSGGVLPSPTALVVLLAAISAHRIGYGLALIAAFSVGLAAALIAIGVLALRARAVVRDRLGGRAAALLPILSAAVIVGFGVYFLVRGALQVAA